MENGLGDFSRLLLMEDDLKKLASHKNSLAASKRLYKFNEIQYEHMLER